MARNLLIVSIALLLVSCASTQLPPMDDAYYWDDSRPSSESRPSSDSSASAPTIEYLNVQDTTVTIRIHK